MPSEGVWPVVDGGAKSAVGAGGGEIHQVGGCHAEEEGCCA